MLYYYYFFGYDLIQDLVKINKIVIKYNASKLLTILYNIY